MPGIKFFKDVKPVEKQLEATNKTKIMLVEGLDECMMFDKILQDKGADPDIIEIIPYRGKKKFELNLQLLLKQDAFLDDTVRALAVFQDADLSLTTTKASISRLMDAQGLPSITFGSFTKKNATSVLHYGSYVFPNNRDLGNLETLLMTSVASRPDAIDADTYVDAHVPAGNKDESKRKAQAYLAVQREVCRGAGQGARDGYFDLTNPCMQSLDAFLDQFITI